MPSKRSRLLERDTRFWAQFIRYGMVGVSATALDLLIFTILSEWVHPSVDPSLGNELRAHKAGLNYTIAFFVANVYTYWVNARWVFVPGRHSKRVEFALFLGVSAISFGLGYLVLHHAISQYGTPTFTAKLASIVVSVLINYACRRFFVFKT